MNRLDFPAPFCTPVPHLEYGVVPYQLILMVASNRYYHDNIYCIYDSTEDETAIRAQTRVRIVELDADVFSNYFNMRLIKLS